MARPGWRRKGWQEPITARAQIAALHLGERRICVRAKRSTSSKTVWIDGELEEIISEVTHECIYLATVKWFGDGPRLWCKAHRWITPEETRIVKASEGIPRVIDGNTAFSKVSIGPVTSATTWDKWEY